MAQGRAAAGDHGPSPADRLAERWNMFRAEHNSLYDLLFWKQLEWPSLALQWQPAAWQLPDFVLELQQVDAEAAEAAALGDEGEAGASATQLGQQQHMDRRGGDKERVPVPLEYHYLLIGDQTSHQEGSSLGLWQVRLPGRLPAGFDLEQQQLVMVPAEIELVLEPIPHGMLDVNKLHSMPSQLHLVATCCDEPQVYLFDLNIAAQQQQPQQGQQQQQGQQHQQQRSLRTGGAANTAGDADDMDVDDSEEHSQGGSGSDSAGASQSASAALVAVLGGRQAGGFGLEWNPQVPGLLLGADAEGGVQLWDVHWGSGGGSSSSNGGGSGEGGSSNGGGSGEGGCRHIQPLQSCPKFAGCSINDVSWHSSGNSFAAATEQGQLLLHDIRTGTAAGAAATATAGTSAAATAAAAGLCTITAAGARSGTVHVARHRKGRGIASPDCLCVEFDPLHPHRLASGGRDGCVCILDMRKLAEPLEVLGLHAGDVNQVSWSRGAPGLLASSGEDSHVLLWDCNKMKHAPKPRPQQHQQPATNQQQGEQQGEPGQAVAAACGVGLALPEPRHTRWSESIKQLTLPGLLFPHHGHMASVDALAWNPDSCSLRCGALHHRRCCHLLPLPVMRLLLLAPNTNRPWMLASCSAAATAKDGQGQDVEVQTATLMVWKVNRCMGLLC